MRFLVEWKEIIYDENGIPQWNENNEPEVEVRRGILHTWGVKSDIDERGGKVVTNTVAIVEDMDTRGVIMLNPEELTIVDKINEV